MRVKAAARAPFFHPFFFRAHRPPNSSSRLPAGFIFTLCRPASSSRVAIRRAAGRLSSSNWNGY